MTDNYQAEMDALVVRSRRNIDLLAAYTQANPFAVQAGPGKIVKGSLVRLNVARDYNAGQEVAHNVGTMVVFNNVTRFANNGSGIIIGGKLTKNTISIANVGFRLWLYQSGFPLDPIQEDGGDFAIRFGRRDDRIGYLDFENFVAGVGCAESQALIGLGQSLLFGMKNGNSLYGIVQTKQPYSSVAGELIDFYLHISQD